MARITALLRWQWEGITRPFDDATELQLKLWNTLDAFSRKLAKPYLIEGSADRLQEDIVQWVTGPAADAARDEIIRQLAARLAARGDVFLPESRR